MMVEGKTASSPARAGRDIPTGKIIKIVSRPLRKNIPLPPTGQIRFLGSLLFFRRPLVSNQLSELVEISKLHGELKTTANYCALLHLRSISALGARSNLCTGVITVIV